MTIRESLLLEGNAFSRRSLLRGGTLTAAAIGLLAGAPSFLLSRRAYAAAEQDVVARQ